MHRISQEFYCATCKHYFLVRLNMALNHEVEIVCPNPECGHKHRRCIVDGVIYEYGRYKTNSKEEILPTIATLSKEPLTKKMREAHQHGNNTNDYCGLRRNGVPVTEPNYDRWLEIAQREKEGD